MKKFNTYTGNINKFIKCIMIQIVKKLFCIVLRSPWLQKFWDIPEINKFSLKQQPKPHQGSYSSTQMHSFFASSNHDFILSFELILP